jgi:hypothetical protein
MGMFDRFFFEKGILPENKVEPDYEFQTKSLECNLDTYKVDSNGNVRKFVHDWAPDGDGWIEDTKPVNESVIVYSHEFIYDNHKDIFNRKYLGTKYQEYKIIIVNNRIAYVEKLTEYGYQPTPQQAPEGEGT